MSGSLDRIANAQQCPYCKGWITLPLRRARAAFEAHKLKCRQEIPGAVQVPEPRERPYPSNPAEAHALATCNAWVESTVKRATLWDGVTDTHQTEAELNGWRATQGALL